MPDTREMTQVWHYEYQERCNDQEEQWDDFKNENTILITKPRDKWRETEGGG